MMNFLNIFTPAFMLQSLDKIRDLMSRGESLAPDYQAYVSTGNFFNDMIGTFAVFFLFTINKLGEIFGSYGLAIVLTAIIVRLLLYVVGLTTAQIRGMKSMQSMQPVMRAIQHRYPDKQQQGFKTMDLYSKYKINPMAGCLPMLVQMPILFGIYRALYDQSFAGHDMFGIQLLFPVNVTSVRSFGMGGADMADIIDTVVSVDKLQGSMLHIPASIPLLGGSTWYAPALILVVLYVASSFWMQKVMRDMNQPDKKFEEEFMTAMKMKDVPRDPTQDAAEQMQRSMKFMNFIIIIFAFIFSAGALLYFIVQNTIMVLEYKLLASRKYIDLDIAELKAWINEPPQSQEQRMAEAQAKRDALLTKAGEPAEDGNTEKNQADDAGEDDDPDDDGSGPSLKRPRKKRRKR
ncbi:MAG: membrane protein insertase YidC [Planctomycetales bacterium]|nr:membrane protein insertase YidC [bacterium]UNM08387.1 MAG: membrane protein insertase YidC [Planctomycetales bacterium]